MKLQIPIGPRNWPSYPGLPSASLLLLKHTLSCGLLARSLDSNALSHLQMVCACSNLSRGDIRWLNLTISLLAKASERSQPASQPAMM